MKTRELLDAAHIDPADGRRAPPQTHHGAEGRMKGPFAVFVTRSASWWRVTALYQGRGWRIARSSGGSFRERAEATETARLLINQMRAN